MLATVSYARLQRQNCVVGEDVEKLKQRLSLLDYLRQQNWVARPASHGPEFVGLCPLHPETRPSFYVNARKNLFYCHGCEQGGDLLRFVQLSRHLSFRQKLLAESKTHVEQVRRQVEEPEKLSAEAGKKRAAQLRAAEERQKRVEQAVAQLPDMKERQKKQCGAQARGNAGRRFGPSNCA
jgi:DNA primase